MITEFRKRLFEDETGTISSGWLCTFNDMMTLLMVFFVLIFSLSTMNVQGIHSARIQLQSGLGIFEAGKKTSIGLIAPIKPYDIGTEVFNRNLEESVDMLDSTAGIHVTFSDTEIIITLDDAVLFESGSANISDDGLKNLDGISDSILTKISNPIRIQGHTDTDSINTNEFPSNWELSTARAVNVLKHLAGSGKILPKRLSAVGYGEVKPVVPNDSVENKAKNRRVELIITTDED